MNSGDYQAKLSAYKKDLEELQDKFSQFSPSTDWNKRSVKPLLDQLDNLTKTIKNWSSPVNEDLIRSDLEYIERNIVGLKTVLQSEQNFANKRNALNNVRNGNVQDNSE